MPALASQEVAATLRSMADECHAFAGVQIPKWDPVFKTALLRKAKAEILQTYIVLVTLQEVLNFINKHLSSGCNSNEALKLMRRVLRVQFTNY